MLGRFAFDLAFDHVVKAVIVAHPSLLTSPADLEVSRVLDHPDLRISLCRNTPQQRPRLF